jgi:hypothetical protein
MTRPSRWRTASLLAGLAAADPGETRDLSQERRDVTRSLRTAIEAPKRGGRQVAMGGPDADVLSRLRALGYVGTPARTAGVH